MSAPPTRHITEEVIPQLAEQSRAPEQGHGGVHLQTQKPSVTAQEVPANQSLGGRSRGNLAGLGVVQVPELDVSVSSGNEVGAVIREGDGGHFAGHLIGRHDYVFLKQTDSSR